MPGSEPITSFAQQRITPIMLVNLIMPEFPAAKDFTPQGQTRLRYAAVTAEPLDYYEEAAALRKLVCSK